MQATHPIDDVPKAWLAVASAEHVRLGRAAGFMQVGHGKGAPLRRLKPGDGIVYYAPTEVLGSGVPYRRLVAAGTVAPGEPYVGFMSDDFRPWRRDVLWRNTQEVPILPLLDQLSFSAGRKNWGQMLRFGLVAITPDDFRLIVDAMHPGAS